MIYILSRTTKKYQKTLSRLLHSKSKKIQGFAQKFKDFSRTSPNFPRLCKPCLSGMINVIHFGCAVLARAAGIPSINNIGFLF